MPKVATHDTKERFARKLGRAFNKLAEPCQFISASGVDPFERGVNLHKATLDISVEYIPEPSHMAEFLKADGLVNCDDRFELNGKQYRLTQLHDVDEMTVSFIYVEF
ncbi:hypothetical protein TUM4261_32840 [Shewanella sp. c952]|uniref:hypothetical protein n=1 Tax=Shewanella sp. c952 TaxID=2815913 RepID=UPI001BBFAC61|nr:hypothetical protein [Shewanella sp. c952]GIU15602.1 hypothetical protein TUM4261_32840 [Shewanella sp. c952]